MLRRGTTMIELLLVVGLTAMVLGTMTLLYAFTFGRTANTAASLTATDQAQKALDEIAETASNAISCSIVTSGGVSALKCTMPASGTDLDGDGYLDVYVPSGVSRRGLNKFTAGKRIWFYLAGSTGTFGSSGTVLWRAQRTDDNQATASDIDTNWTYYYGGSRERLGLITTFTPSIDAAAKTTTITVCATSLMRNDSEAGSESGPGTHSVTFSRTVFWRTAAQ